MGNGRGNNVEEGGKMGEWGVVGGGGVYVLYTFRGEGVVFCEEFSVFAGEDVVGHGCYAVFVSESEAEGEH